jgi:O-antigen ligase
MYLTIAITAILSLVYFDIPAYIHNALIPGIEPKYFYWAFAAIVVPLLVLRFREFLLYMVSAFPLWLIAEIIITSFALIDGNKDTVHLVLEIDQYFILILLLGFIASITPTESYQGIFLFLAIAVPVLVIIDFVNPGIFYPVGMSLTVPGRAAAMYLNANRASEAIMLTCLLAIPLTRLHYRMPLLLLAGAGIIVTFSRGPTLVWMLFCLFLLVTRKLPKYSFAFFIVAVLVMPLLLSIFTSYLLVHEDHQDLDNLLGRLDFFQSHTVDDDSAQGRIAVLKASWGVFLENPIFGAGTGITSFQTYFWPFKLNTHNQIALVAAEHGIFGIALWAWLLVILWRGRYFPDRKFQQAAAVGVFLMAFFNHNMFTTLYWLMTFALVSGRRQVEA